jgi:hypothetical protein
MPSDLTGRHNGNGAAGSGFPLSGLTAELLGPAPSEATAVIYTQMAHAVGLAMQNIVSQQQTLNTINNAIATKALNLLADKDPASALEQIRKQFDSTTSNTVEALTRLAGLTRGGGAAGGGASGGGTSGGGASGSDAASGQTPAQPPEPAPPHES